MSKIVKLDSFKYTAEKDTNIDDVIDLSLIHISEPTRHA